MEEIYKTIDEFENYEISNLGNVRNKKSGRILKGRIDGAGYYQVDLCKYGKGTSKKIHRLVCEIFLKNPEDKDCVDHIDGNKLKNYLENLRWCSYKENQQNSKIHKDILLGLKV